MKIRKLYLILLGCIIVILPYLGGINKRDRNKLSTNQVKDSIEESIEKSITISFAGDVTLGNYKGASPYGSFDHEVELQDKNYRYFLEGVNSLFEKDDLTIVNLEGPFTVAQTAKVKQFAFKGHPEYVNILKEGSVEAVSISNNHSEDYFEQGINETKAILDDKEIDYFGLGKNSIIEVNGIRVGILGYNGWPENYNEKYLKNIEEEINKLKQQSDVIISYFHWGNENSYYPNEIQKKFAHYVIDTGVDVVVGSHPHVVQGIELYKGKYIAYSLGNFCFGGNKNPRDKDSFIYQQTLKFTDGKLNNINEPKIIPISISSVSNRNNYKPMILEGDEKNRIINKIKNISKNLSQSE